MIPTRCHKCCRVRWHAPGAGDWVSHPRRIPGEVVVECATCAELRRRTAAWKRFREGQKLLADRASGYGAAPEGTDVFASMKEGDR